MSTVSISMLGAVEVEKAAARGRNGGDIVSLLRMELESVEFLDDLVNWATRVLEDEAKKGRKYI